MFGNTICNTPKTGVYKRNKAEVVKAWETNKTCGCGLLPWVDCRLSQTDSINELNNESPLSRSTSTISLKSVRAGFLTIAV